MTSTATAKVIGEQAQLLVGPLIGRLIPGVTAQIELGPAALAVRGEIDSMAVGERRNKVQAPPGLGVHVHGVRLWERLGGVVDFDDKRSGLSVDPDRDWARRDVQHGVGDQLTGDQLDSVQLFLVEPYVPGTNGGHDAAPCLLDGSRRAGDGERELVVRCHKRVS